jgi:hypothetical protein
MGHKRTPAPQQQNSSIRDHFAGATRAKAISPAEGPFALPGLIAVLFCTLALSGDVRVGQSRVGL